MELKPGYKQTEMGVIPEEWSVSSLQDACRETITYGIVQCGPHIGNGIPYVRVSDMDKPELDVGGMLRTSPAIAARFSRSTVQQGDLVYALRGKLGEVRQVSSSVAGANLTQGTARLSPKDGVLSDYLKWGMRSTRVVRQAEIEAKGTTFREITLADLRRICLPIAPLPEQHAIAAALGDMDALLGALTQLIAKKRDLKQAAMQRLLTGQQRLPGFSGEWEVKRLGDVAHINMGQSPVSKFYNQRGDGIPLIQGNADIADRRSIRRVWTTQFAKTCNEGDLLLTVRAPVGAIGISSEYSCLGRGVCSLVPKSADSSFLFHSLVDAEPQWKVLEQGSTFTSANSAQVAGFQMMFPPKRDEQRAIATVLSDMDAELEALQARLAKTRALKQGMMQELLTGRTRLV
jgi:type I restriction enzyme, S subunit